MIFEWVREKRLEEKMEGLPKQANPEKSSSENFKNPSKIKREEIEETVCKVSESALKVSRH